MAKKATNGVREYTKATVEIYFAKGEESCQYCPLLGDDRRAQCKRTGEYIIDTRTRGLWCPMRFEEVQTDDEP